MSISSNYEAPRMQNEMLEFVKDEAFSQERVYEIFRNTPDELYAFTNWAQAFGNLIDDYQILKDINTIAKELQINENKTLEKVNGLFQQVIQDPEVKYFADQMELVNLDFKDIVSVLNDQTIQKILKDEKKLPLIQKIIQNIYYVYFNEIINHKHLIPKDIISTVINSLTQEQLEECINPTSYAREPKNFERDLPFFIALTKKDTGQELILKLLLDTSNETILIKAHNDLIKSIVSSLLPHMDTKYIYELFIRCDINQETILFDTNIFWHAIPFLFSKLSADQFIQILTVKNYRQPLLSFGHLRFLLQIPSLTEKLLPRHFQTIFSWPEETIPLRRAFLKGLISQEILKIITGQDLDVQSILREDFIIGRENITSLQFNWEINKSTKEQIRGLLFDWAINKPIHEKNEAIKLALSMGCIQNFFDYIATMSESKRLDFLNELGVDIVFHALSTPDDRGDNICEKDVNKAIPLMEFLLTKEGGEKKINSLLTTTNYELQTLIGSRFEHLVPFFNKILEKENGFDILKEILFTRDVVNYIFGQQIKPLMQLNLNSEQLTHVLSIADTEFCILFSKLFVLDNGYLLWEKLETQYLSKLLANSLVMHFYPRKVIPILEKILEDKDKGFAEIKELFFTDSRGLKPSDRYLSTYVPILKKLLKEEGGPEFVRSLITPLCINRFYESLRSYEIDESTKATFTFFGEIGFSENEIMDLVFSEKYIPFYFSNYCVAAIPLLEKLADHVETKNKIKAYIMREGSIFWNVTFLKEAMPLLAKLGPNSDPNINAFTLLSKDANFRIIIHHLATNDRISEISPILPFLSSEIILKLFSKYINTSFVSPQKFSEIVNTFAPHLNSEDLAKFLLLDLNYFVGMLIFGCLKKEILIKAFGIDFDSTPLYEPKEIERDSKELQALIRKWIQSKNEESEKAKSLLLPYLLDYTDIFQEEYKKLSEVGLRELHAIMPKGAMVKLMAAPYQLRSQHMHEGVSFKESVPEPIPMETVPFIDQKDANYAEFHSFLPHLIHGIAEELRHAHIQFESYLDLMEMEKKIRTNEYVYGLPQHEQERKKEYQNFCSFLTHIVKAYRLGQEGGDLDDKIMVCNAIANASTVCFPAWMKEISQLYSCIKTNDTFVMPTIRDRLLAMLQTERIYILTMNMPMEGENIHEPNYLQDLFREDLNTGLDPIDDIQNAQYKLYYQKDKTRLRNEFDEYYSKEYILTIITDHINDQHKRTKESKHFQDLPPAQVTDWIREHIASKWKQDEYEAIPARVRKMQADGVPLQEIDNFLNTYGIVRQKEETVAEATRKLENELQRHSQNVITRTFSNLSNEIDEIFSGKDKTKWIDKKKSFIVRHPDIKVNDYSTEGQFKKALSGWNKEQRNIRIGLETIKKELEGAPNKLEVLKKFDRIRPAQSLDEVLQINNMKEAQIAQFFDDVVYREVPDPKHPGNMITIFTLEASALLLESMGVFTKQH